MSNYRENEISISGDGNAVGDNNRLTIIKHERHHHDHRQPRPSGGGGSSTDLRPLLFGLAFAMISVCVVGCYIFALHAQVVYTVMHLVSGAEFMVVLWLMYVTFDDEGELEPKHLVMAMLTTVASTALFTAHADYQDELTSLAQTSINAMQFWCRMSDYGREQVLFHALTATVGFGLGSLVLALPAGAMIAARLSGDSFEDNSWAVTEQLSSWGIIAFGAVLLLGSAYLHTDGGKETWSGAFGHPPSFFCGNAAGGTR